MHQVNPHALCYSAVAKTYRWVLIVCRRAIGQKEFGYGKVSFWGSQRFCDYAGSAVAIISAKDSNSGELLRGLDVTFWECQKSSFQVGRVFGIGPEYVGWEQENIITYLIMTIAVYKAVGAELFSSRKPEGYWHKVHSAYLDASKVAKCWALPDELTKALHDSGSG